MLAGSFIGNSILHRVILGCTDSCMLVPGAQQGSRHSVRVCAYLEHA